MPWFIIDIRVLAIRGPAWPPPPPHTYTYKLVIVAGDVVFLECASAQLRNTNEWFYLRFYSGIKC